MQIGRWLDSKQIKQYFPGRKNLYHSSTPFTPPIWCLESVTKFRIEMTSLNKHLQTQPYICVWFGLGENRRTGSWGHLCGQRNIFIYWNVPSNRSCFLFRPQIFKVETGKMIIRNLENCRCILVFVFRVFFFYEYNGIVRLSHSICPHKIDF